MFFIFVLTTIACLTVRSLSSEHEGYLAPLHGMDAQDKYPDEYLVAFYKNHTLEQHFYNIGQNLSSLPRFCIYPFGYQVTMDSKTRDELVRRDPGVRSLETNGPAYLVEPHEVIPIEPSELLQNQTSRLSKRNYGVTVSDQAPYGLQMLTTGKHKLGTPISDDGYYEYMSLAGLGVNVYVMDTGIRLTHERFGRRASNFGGLKPNDKSPYVDANMDDVKGHGTHVAGIVGADTYGVAPRANLINVKVLDDYGKASDKAKIATALTDIIREHNENKERYKSNPKTFNFRGSVINISFTWFGGGDILAQELKAANEAGISVFAAAGNENESTGDWYPCANTQTKCVAAVDNTYSRWKSSNWGSKIEFAAPGKLVLSTYINSGNIGVAALSGTSQASPHAAGAAALFASWSGLESKNDLSQNFVYWNSISGMVTGFRGITNLINTGIHSPKKYAKEPFRFAGDSPHDPQLLDDPSSTVIDAWTTTAPPPVPSSELMTTFYTSMTTSTLAPVGSQVTLPGVVSDLPPVGTASTSVPDPLTATSSSCASSGTAFAQAAAQKLIPTFCAQSEINAQFVPYIAFGNGTNQDGEPKSLAAAGHFSLDGTTNKIWFRMQFSHEEATGSFNGTYKCAEYFYTILNGCQTNTITAKLGGTLTQAGSEYDLIVVDENTNPFTDDDLPVGDFTCKDSPLISLIPNTCTCWMSKRATQTALFVKPANGVCDAKNINQQNDLAPGQGY